ncbi:MAG: hypothetical protein WEE50_04840 [Chloroflexota bacterium]
MKPGAALSGALLTSLALPATWPLALATFLLRGGILLVVLPIVVLPSPVGLGNLLAPTLVAVVFGGPSVEVAAIVTVSALAIVTWIVVGGLVAATLEVDAARTVAGDEAVSGRSIGISGDGPAASDRMVAAWVLAARLLAHGPTGIGFIWGSIRLVDIAYRELTSPADVTAPIVLRVLAGAPEVTAVLLLAWTFGEIVGGLAARRIALDGSRVTTALRDALRATVRHPVGVAAAFVVPLAGLALVVLPSTLAATVAWSAVRVAMRSPADLVVGTLAVVLFVSLWIVGLLLIAVTAAWRAAVWSVAHRDLWPRPAQPPTLKPG